MRRARNPWPLLAVAAIPALAGALVLAAVRDGSAPATTAPADSPAPPPIVAARFVCSFSEGAASALIQGADGGQTVVIDGRTYWLFGDTLFLAASGKQIEANTIAWSDARDDRGCPELTFHARDGIAVPFIEKDGSLTVWPSGAIANDDGTFDVFTIYIYGSGPWAYWIGEVGLARVDPRTMEVVVTKRSLFDAESGFRSQIIAAQPVDEDEAGRLRVVLQAQDGEKLLARVPRTAIAEADAYEYWDGASWRDDPAAAATLWRVDKPSDPVAALAAFEGSSSIAWSDAFAAYVAVSNTGHASIGVRFAAQLEGPWSEAVPWIDCTRIASPRVPVCYAPTLHPHLSGEGSLFVTLTRFTEYDVVAYELTPGAPVHEYRNDDAVAYAFASPGDGWRDVGVGFHASPVAAPGLAPVYRWQRDGETAYAPESPADGFQRIDVAFYAPLTPPDAASPLHLRPVYAWSDGASHALSTIGSGLERYGLSRGEIMLYTP